MCRRMRRLGVLVLAALLALGGVAVPPASPARAAVDGGWRHPDRCRPGGVTFTTTRVNASRLDETRKPADWGYAGSLTRPEAIAEHPEM